MGTVGGTGTKWSSSGDAAHTCVVVSTKEWMEGGREGGLEIVDKSSG